MNKTDYLKLADQYSTFLAAVGSISIAVLAIILSANKPGRKSETAKAARLFLIPALIVATVTCFIGGHLLTETSGAISYARGAATDCAGKTTIDCMEINAVGYKEKTSGKRLFLLATTNIFVAALLVLFAFTLLPFMEKEEIKKSIAPFSLLVFVLVSLGILSWLLLAAYKRMPPDNPGWCVLMSIDIGVIVGRVNVICVIFKKYRYSAPFIPALVSTVGSFFYFTLSFYDQARPWDWDVIFFGASICSSFTSLLVAGRQIRYAQILEEKTIDDTKAIPKKKASTSKNTDEPRVTS